MAKVSQTNDKEKKKNLDKRSPFVIITSSVVFIVIIVAFVFMGTNGSGAARANFNRGDFGSYNGRAITYTEGTHLFNIIQGYMNYFGNNKQMFRSIAQEAFDQTVLHYAYLDYADSIGFTLSPQGLINQLKKEDPNFSTLNLKKETTVDLNLIDRKNSVLQQILASDFVDLIRSPSNFDNFIKTPYLKSRSFNMIRFDKEDYPETEVVKFANQNTELFTRFDLASVTLPNEENALDVQKRLQANPNDITKIIEELKNSSNGDLNGKWGVKFFYELKKDAPFEGALDLVKNLKKGMVSNPVKSGNQFIVVLAQTDPILIDLSKTDDSKAVRTYLESNESSKIEDYIEVLAKQYQKPELNTIEKISKASGKKVLTTESFAINIKKESESFSGLPIEGSVKIKGENGEALNDLQARQEFFLQAFKIQKNQISEIVKGQGTVYFLELAAEKEADKAPLEGFNSIAKTTYQRLSAKDVERVLIDKKKIVNKVQDAFLNTLIEN